MTTEEYHSLVGKTIFVSGHQYLSDGYYKCERYDGDGDLIVSDEDGSSGWYIFKSDFHVGTAEVCPDEVHEVDISALNLLL